MTKLEVIYEILKSEDLKEPIGSIDLDVKLHNYGLDSFSHTMTVIKLLDLYELDDDTFRSAKVPSDFSMNDILNFLDEYAAIDPTDEEVEDCL